MHPEFLPCGTLIALSSGPLLPRPSPRPPAPGSPNRRHSLCLQGFPVFSLPILFPFFSGRTARCRAKRPMAQGNAWGGGRREISGTKKRTQSMVFTYLRSLIFPFSPQIDVILWANMPILGGTSTTNYIPICLATSAAKSSLFFSRPSPVSKRMNFFTLMDAPLALATAATYWETLCLPSSAFT